MSEVSCLVAPKLGGQSAGLRGRSGPIYGPIRLETPPLSRKDPKPSQNTPPGLRGGRSRRLIDGVGRTL